MRGLVHRRRGRLPALLAAGLCALQPLAAPLRAQTADALVVGTSGDYAPFSVADAGAEQGFRGFDVELARRFAADRGLELRFVRFRWPSLLEALRAGRFDVALSGVTQRPERSLAGRFGVSVLETGALALVREGSFRELAALDRPQIRIGVNAGGHLERVTARRFPRANRLAIPDNAAVLLALREGAVDAVVTDSAEAPRWRAELPGLAALGPFTRDRKAPLWRSERGALAAELDAWLLEAEADGRLEALRREHVGPGPWRRSAEPLAALLAALDERLSLMPLVGFVKREVGVPLEVPEREAVVLDAAGRALARAAEKSGSAPPAPAAVRRFFRAQMEAAKQVQLDAVADRDYRPEPPLPDLDAELRPALLRIGDRIARLLLALPAGLDPERVRAEAAELLREPRLSAASREQLAAAILELAKARPQGDAQRPYPDPPRDTARASRPAATGSATHTP